MKTGLMRKNPICNIFGIFMILSLVFYMFGCEEDDPTDPGEEYEPETYLSPQHSLAWSPDGSAIVFVFDNVLVVKDMATEDISQLTGTGAYDEPTWSPDSIKIAYSTASYGVRADIWSKNADGTTVAKRITSHNASDYRPRWSPDGSKIVFHSFRTKSMDIWIINFDGSGDAEAMTTDTAVDQNAEWSPDGTRLAFESKRTENYDIWVVDIANPNEPLQVTSDAGTDIQAVWSPDGDKLAFKSDRDGATGIWVKNADGTGDAIKISTDHLVSEMHNWSSDGSWVAYVSEEVIYAKNSDGTGETTQVTSGLEPRCSPDGQKLGYVAWIDSQYEVSIIDLPEELRGN